MYFVATEGQDLGDPEGESAVTRDVGSDHTGPVDPFVSPRRPGSRPEGAEPGPCGSSGRHTGDVKGGRARTNEEVPYDILGPGDSASPVKSWWSV